MALKTYCPDILSSIIFQYFYDLEKAFDFIIIYYCIKVVAACYISGDQKLTQSGYMHKFYVSNKIEISLVRQSTAHAPCSCNMVQRSVY